MPAQEPPSSPLQIFLIYLRLGCLSFGGPVAHLGYFKKEFVNRRRWLDEARYAELLGLCQFVPGPSSSQLGFSIGWHRGGLCGACAAWLGFTLPSALLMFGFAYGLFAWEMTMEPIIRGLLIAAVAVVANATLSLGKKLCSDIAHVAIALSAGALVLLVPGSYAQILAIALGGFLGYCIHRKSSPIKIENSETSKILGAGTIYAALIAYLALLAVSLVLTAESVGGIYALHYRAGALVFGGGHVVLPLLNDSIVAGGLVSEESFLAGYSAAQALPGPLFSLSAFLGTVNSETQPLWLGGIGTLIAIFLPGILLLLGLLPFWNQIRSKAYTQACLSGANAAVVGLLLAALIDPVWTHGIRTFSDAVIALFSLLALKRYKLPAWLLVLACGTAGWILF